MNAEARNAEESLTDSAALATERGAAEDGLLGRIEVIEAQPLAERAAKFDQVYEELLAELQAGDSAR